MIDELAGLLVRLFAGITLIFIGIISIYWGCTEGTWPGGVMAPALGIVIILGGIKLIIEGVARG